MLEGVLLIIAFLLSITHLTPITGPILAILILVCLPGLWAGMGGAPFVPTPPQAVETMLRFAQITTGQRVYDLGAGDGRLLRAAASKGAKATGFEISLPAYLLSTIRIWGIKNIALKFKDFWHEDIRDADVIFAYLLPKTMIKFHEQLWPSLRPGTRVISHAFSIEGLTPTKHEHGVFLYVK